MVTVLAFIALSGQTRPASCCPNMNAFAANPAFLAAHQAPLPFKFRSRQGRSVEFPGGAGYFVGARPGVKTAIVMVHEWWGLNDYVKRQAIQLHEKTGYAVLAVDLYGGQVAKTPQEAGKLMGSVDATKATTEVEGAVKALTSGRLGARFTKLGAIGWCFGGGWSLQTAIQGGPVVKACVMYYGMPDDDPAHLAKLHAPVLLVEALKDKWISPEVVAKFKIAMANAHRSLTVRTYNDDHAFANPSSPHYAAADANDAMAATLRFFKTHLGP